LYQEVAMNHRIMKSNSSLLSTASMFGAVALGMAGLAGCAAASDASPQPATQAAAIARTECGPGYRDDAQVAEILNGSLVEGAAPLYAGTESSRSHLRLEGASIRVRPLKGTSSEWLARALTCHGAEQTLAQGQGHPFTADPFSLPGSLPQIHVRSAGDAFNVEVTGETGADAAEILSRAKALARSSGMAEANVSPDRQIAVDLR